MNVRSSGYKPDEIPADNKLRALRRAIVFIRRAAVRGPMVGIHAKDLGDQSGLQPAIACNGIRAPARELNEFIPRKFIKEGIVMT